MDLHNSARHLESDRELKDIFRSPEFRVHTLSELAGLNVHQEERSKIMEVTFWSAVNDLLENRGGGIIFAVASVISRYLRSAIFCLDTSSQEEFRCLSELGKSVLAGLLRFRKDKYPTSRRYIVLAPTLNLSEAVSLEPQIIGYALGSSVGPKLRVAAELLGVPAVAGLEGLDGYARDIPFARLDGGQGTIEAIPESDHQVIG